MVVSFVSKPIDSRLNRGVIVLGVDDTVLPVGEEAKEVLEELLAAADTREAPFSILFCAEEHEIERDNYEEESFGEDSIDDEVHNSGSFDIDALQEQEQYQQEREEQLQRRQHQHQHQQSQQQARESGQEQDRGATTERIPLTDAASLLKSSVMSMSSSLASKYRHMRGTTSASGSGVKTTTTGDGEDTEEEYEEDEKYGEEGYEGQYGMDEHYEAMVMSDNMFDLLLPGRSPPFVFDLHADGSSVVVVKLVGSKHSMDPRLKEGCVVRGINGRAVYCSCRQDFDQMLAMVSQCNVYVIYIWGYSCCDKYFLQCCRAHSTTTNKCVISHIGHLYCAFDFIYRLLLKYFRSTNFLSV